MLIRSVDELKKKNGGVGSAFSAHPAAEAVKTVTLNKTED
jgi:hypothetical protein